MGKEKILLVGGGGHCKSVIDAIESQGIYEIAGILDSPEKVGNVILGYNIIGTDEELPGLLKDIPNAIVTVGQLKSAAIRMKLYHNLKKTGITMPVIIASTAYVSRHASISEGSVILHQAVINAGATIGVNAIINTAALIEHDAQVGDHTHISTGAIVNGNCKVGNQVFCGSNAVLKQSVKVGNGAVIGAGAVVIRDVNNGVIIIGNPAREL